MQAELAQVDWMGGVQHAIQHTKHHHDITSANFTIWASMVTARASQ